MPDDVLLVHPKCVWTPAIGADCTQRQPDTGFRGTPLDLADRLDFQPDPLQQEILLCDSKQILLLMGRQCGKSTIIALKAVHAALTRPGFCILCAGRVGRQSVEFLDKVRDFLDSLKIPFKGSTDLLRLPNGSRFIAIPGTQENVRGYSKIGMLIIDEAAYASEPLYRSLRPMLATTNGTVILLSTANGRKGFFYEEWMKPEEWTRFSQTSLQCPRIAPEYMERERRNQPDFWFRQEYLCEFIDGAGSLFRLDKLMECLDPNFEVRDL